MNEDKLNEGYLDMLIEQSFSNEDKAGSKADSVGAKLMDIAPEIIKYVEIVKRLREEIEVVPECRSKECMGCEYDLYRHKLNKILGERNA